MYLGKVVELAEADELCSNPQHPYTKALLSAIPVPDPREAKEREQIIIEGEIPSPTEEFTGCEFCNRCAYATEECKKKKTEMLEISKGHFVSCNLFKETL